MVSTNSDIKVATMQNRHRNIHRHLKTALESCPNEKNENFKKQGSSELDILQVLVT